MLPTPTSRATTKINLLAPYRHSKPHEHTPNNDARKTSKAKLKMLDHTSVLSGRHVVKMPTFPETEHPIGGRRGDPELTKQCPEGWPKRCPERWPERCPNFPALLKTGRGILGHLLGHLGWHHACQPVVTPSGPTFYLSNQFKSKLCQIWKGENHP